ncbi:MAG: hypothetical protein LUG64_02400 [Clostridiales bacterium]|nr:hypothetical protein [Clostridiales bacterium]
MYNSTIKWRFIADFSMKDSMVKAARTLFNLTEQYEEFMGRDLCTMDEATVKLILEQVLGGRAGNAKARLHIIHSYGKWCLENQVPGASDGILTAEPDPLVKFKNQTVANPQHLQMYLDSVFDKESDETQDLTFSCFFWHGYAGMDEKDTFCVKTSDVDFELMVVKFNCAEYPIYREAVQAFAKCVRLDSFRYNHPNFKADTKVYREREKTDALLRGTRSRTETSFLRDVSRKTCSKKNKLFASQDEGTAHLSLNYQRIQLSGLFYRISEAERLGRPADFDAVAKRIIAERDAKSGKTSDDETIRRIRQRAIANDYSVDYNRWKEAYKI